MGPQHRRRLLSTGAWLSALTIFAIVSWLYVFREGTASRLPPPVAFKPIAVPSTHAASLPVEGLLPGIVTQSTRTLLTTTTDEVKGAQTHIPSITGSIASWSRVSSFSTKSKAATTPKMQSPISIATSASVPVVRLRQGIYKGKTNPANGNHPKSIESFLGIPYAQDTSGENRFRPAVPVPDSSATFDAVTFGPTCLGSWSGLPESEDCLRLNVYRPAGSVTEAGSPETKPLPVVIYVHGGSFNTGHGGERNMASFVSWAKEDILAVSFNYRTGPFGFLPSALTAREGLLNLGLKDQQALFRWVKENIVAFGGDPENITIMGLSAGAHSVGHHVVYYGNSSTSAPFQKAILESGACTARAVFYPTHPRHLVQFREFLVAAGVEGVPESEVFDALRKLDGKTLNAASKKVWAKYTDSVTWPFQPVIDGPNAYSNSSNLNSHSSEPVVPDLPFHSWQKGHHLRIPVLTGFNTNEGTMFIPPKADTNEDFRSFFGTLIPGFSKKDLDDLEKFYPDPVTDPSSPYQSVPEGMGRQWARLDAAYSHYAYICPVLQTAHFLSTNDATPDNPSFSKSTHGTRATEGKPPVYVYHYAALSKWGTANHGDEAAIVAHDMSVIASGLTPVAELTHDTADIHPSPVSQKPGLRAISDAMHTAWVNFIVSKDGNPNPLAKTGQEWPAFESPFGGKGKGRLVKFGEGNDERLEAGGSEGVPVKVEKLGERELEVCRFWWERVEVSQGVGRRLNQSRL